MYLRFLIRSTQVCLISIALTQVSTADISTQWETDTSFNNPESVLFDPANKVLYVSNVNGSPVDKDGNGYISRLGMDGNIEQLKWVEGLNGPKGMAANADSLFVSDITALVEIDIAAGEIINTYDIADAKFLNDVAIDEAGNVYVSDMVDNKLYRLKDGDFAVWVDDEALENPNGLFVDNGALIVGSWGKMNPDFSTDVPGHLKSISLADGTVETLGSGEPVGNLDGVEASGNGNYLVSDWVSGAVFEISPSGDFEMLIDLNQGSADIEAIIAEKMMIVPMMNDNKVVAYQY